MAGNVVFLLVVRLQLAEQLRRGLELVRHEMLVAHHQHVMRGEGLVQRGAGFDVDRLLEIEADDLGAGVIGQRRDGEGCHERSLHAGILLSERYRRPGVTVKRRPDSASRQGG